LQNGWDAGNFDILFITQEQNLQSGNFAVWQKAVGVLISIA